MLLLSVIIPVLNESGNIEETLKSLQPLMDEGHEVIIVDGGSCDDTILKCKKYTANILVSKKGRAIQMNYGAASASNNVLVFLHADILVPSNFSQIITQAIAYKNKQWGFFRVKLSSDNILLKIVSYFMNARSCLTSIATGDQTIFVTKSLFNKINGFENIALMEDIEISKNLKQHTKPYCAKSYITASSRKWKQEGVIRTILLMWKIRLFYFFGVSTDDLVKMYYK